MYQQEVAIVILTLSQLWNWNTVALGMIYTSCKYRCTFSDAWTNLTPDISAITNGFPISFVTFSVLLLREDSFTNIYVFFAYFWNICHRISQLKYYFVLSFWHIYHKELTWYSLPLDKENLPKITTKKLVFLKRAFRILLNVVGCYPNLQHRICCNSSWHWEYPSIWIKCFCFLANLLIFMCLKRCFKFSMLS